MSTAHRSAGQILLIVLLGVTGALFMVLSIASRSINDLSQTNQGQQSSEAFSAAEAGIEQALLGSTQVGTLAGGSSYAIAKNPYNKGLTYYNYPQPLLSGEVAYLWLVSHDANGNLTCSDGSCFSGQFLNVCWGSADASPIPALEVEVYYDTTGASTTSNTFAGMSLVRAVFDSDTTRIASNNFSNSVSVNDPSCVLEGVPHAYKATLDLEALGINNSCYPINGCLVLAVAKVLYATSKQEVGFYSGGNTFPSQGYVLQSTGSAGNSVRKVELVQTFENPDAIFTNGIFTNSSIQ